MILVYAVWWQLLIRCQNVLLSRNNAVSSACCHLVAIIYITLAA